MSRSAWRWVVLASAFWVLGPLSAWAFSRLHAPDGGPDVSMLLAEKPVLAFLAGAGAIAIALAAGSAASAWFGARTGMFTAGLVLIWPAWASGSIAGIIRRTHSPDPLWTLALEGLLIASAVAGGSWLIARDHSPVPAGDRRRTTRGSGMPASLVAALAVGAVAAWAVARTDLPGQTIAAAFFAGVLGTMAAVLIDPRPGLPAVLSVIALLMVIGPASGALAAGDQVVQHLYAGTLLPLARPMPLHWAAGLLLGVPVGASWASSLVRRG